MSYEATYSFNVRRHLHVVIDAGSPEEAERIAKAEAMKHIDAEIEAIQNSVEMSDTERLEPFLYLDQLTADGTEVICEERLPDPEAAQLLPDPLPVDLIVASRDVIAAFGGDVPDWLASEIGMLQLALKPFADQPLPVPAANVGEGDEMPIRRLEQREGADLHVIVNGFWNVLDEALGLDEIEEPEAMTIVDNMLRKHIGGWDDLAALVTVKQGDQVTELWASDRYPDSEGVPFTCVWVRDN